ncbi:hypothetical protein [uncultured Tateyamaria sp.]|uniref:hypothetical protein n=1 Tax=uncultured Tateyamaria sp. TaxID=455651 RepID=UPI002621E028|nr:hypothetical protein [uncultured Tateyamaria sp.]
MTVLLRSFYAGCAALVLTGCNAIPNEEGLYLIEKPEGGVSSVRTSKSITQIAAAFQAAGFGDVAIIDGGSTVEASTRSEKMVNCGTIAQVALGKRATFPGSAPLAAVIYNEELFVRLVNTRSIVRVQMGQGDLYSISEDHRVTLEYQTPDGTSLFRQTKSFDQQQGAAFADGVTCESAGAARAVL